MGKNKDYEQGQALEGFIDQGLIEEVLGLVKSGKEATVYLCATANGEEPLVAAKVYRSRDVRRFANDAAYRQGRARGMRRREALAIASKSRLGRELSFAGWVEAEYTTLSLLYDAGADVPRPIAQSENALLMEYVGDDEGPAPALASVRLEPDEAQRLFERLMHNVELSLAHNRVHGDLSAFNVLYRRGDVRIIDFPQAVDARFNANAHDLIERDIERLHGYFARFGVEAEPRRVAREMWGRFIRSEL